MITKQSAEISQLYWQNSKLNWNFYMRPVKQLAKMLKQSVEFFWQSTNREITR